MNMESATIKGYRRALQYLNRIGRDRKRWRWTEQEIKDALLVELNFAKDTVTYQHIQRMIRFGYLIAVPSDTNLLNDYEMGEAGLDFIQQQDPVVI